MKTFLFLLLFLTACAAEQATDTQTIQTTENREFAGPEKLYQEYQESVYYVKTECVYEYEYPDFFIRSSIDRNWGILIDLTMKKNAEITETAQISDWAMATRVNSTKQYGTAFAV